ncbi:MAG: hypothetical protein CM15mP74_01070 [Halieaceae bacterium]|nr:MAG: hypothetical protein CM15mP74_01070 [Halieaceae bacterium]
MDMGDYVVVVNCEKVRVTGAKRTDKMYYHHTGFLEESGQQVSSSLLRRHLSASFSARSKA